MIPALRICTKARAPSKPLIKCGAVSRTAMMSATAASAASAPGSIARRRGFLIAQHPVDFGHGRQADQVNLRRAAGDDNRRRRIFRRALRIAWRAWRSASAVTARVLKNRIGQAGASAWPHDLALESVKAARKCADRRVARHVHGEDMAAKRLDYKATVSA